MVAKTTLVTICMMLLASAAMSITVKNRCLPAWYDSNGIAFDLNPVKTKPIDKPDNITTDSISVAFQFCNPITPSQVDPTWTCDNKPDGNIAFVRDKTTGQCYPMTDVASTLSQELIKVGDDVKGVRLVYDNKNAKEGFFYKNKNVKINIMCNKDIDNANIQWIIDDSDAKFLIFTTSAKAGCGASVKDLISLFNNFKLVAAGIIFMVGILFTFFGKRFFTITLTTTGFLIGFIAIAGTAYVFGAMQTSDAKKIGVLLLISVLLGILVGWLFYKFKKLTTMAACGILFFFIGNALLRLYLSRWITKNWMEISWQVVFALIGVAFGYAFSKQCIMFSTAFGGSFLIVLALGVATNTYYSPEAVVERVRRGEAVVSNLLLRPSCMSGADSGSWLVLLDLLYSCTETELILKKAWRKMMSWATKVILTTRTTTNLVFIANFIDNNSSKFESFGA